jgi:glucans biosynthesis protein
MAEDFSFEAVRALAKSRAAVAFVAPADDLADFWKNLTYDQHRDIRFKMDEGLWAADKKPFSIDFFHPGWTAKKSVKLYEVDGAEPKPLFFDRSLFDYGKQQIPNGIPSPPGYAGWRARTHLNSADYMDEFLVFLGASYFRSIPAKAPYGLSARAISLNSGLPGVPEEFPDFQSFWLKTPQPLDKSLTTWALLDGPSVSGAYQFIVTPGPETVMEIEAEITLRQPVQQLGLAPFSSMFWFGELTHPRAYDFRPEVHDSDGLLMELSTGAKLFRPLDHTPDQFRHCVFTLENAQSWSLLQRDRSFTSYQDVEAHYHDRPSVRVEPLEGFDKGQLHLIEMPTTDETNDNVILVFEPDPKPETGKPFHFKYRLIWQRDPAPSGLFAVKDTRYGHPVQKPGQLLFTIDFAKPLAAEKKVGDPKWDDITGCKPVVTTNNPAVKILHTDITDLSMANVDSLPLEMGRNPGVHMPQVLRAFFVLEPPADLRDLDLTCELQNAEGKAISERWLYLWKKP